MGLNPEHRHGVTILALVVILITLIVTLASRRPEVADEPERAVHLSTDLRTSVDVDEPKGDALRMTLFDPNTVELKELLGMGVDRSAAVSLLRYRASGKIFRIKEELIECYGFNDSLYFALEPYITIGEEFRFKPKPSASKIEPVAIASSEESEARRDSVVATLKSHSAYRERNRNAGKLEEGSVDLNHADSATLVSLSGIGAKSAQAIIRYRELLGGYHSVTQLFEIPIITESNFLRFYKYFYTNIVDISKIDINFASAVELSAHPYFTAARVKKLTKKRNTKGGWSNIEQMVDDDIFTKQEAQHVQPYLIFCTIENQTE